MTGEHRTEQPTVVCLQRGDDLEGTVRQALQEAGILARIAADSRVAIKPNFTYPWHKRGVTTTPEVLRAVVGVLRDYTAQLAVVETDGGYGAWQVEESFAGHGLAELHRQFGVQAVNLCQEPSEPLEVRGWLRKVVVPLPVRLLYETDLLLTMPVPKIHAMTRVSLALKNQWGVIPDIMRLRKHYLFDKAIVAINQRLRPAVLGDGTWFLDINGPMAGEPVRMDLIIAASDAGSFDRYVSELMGIDWRRVGHFRQAIRAGIMPESLDHIQFNAPPTQFRTRTFRLRRTLRNYIALCGFCSRTITWLGYESWFGRVVLHGILYAIAGRPVSPQAAAEAADCPAESRQYVSTRSTNSGQTARK